MTTHVSVTDRTEPARPERLTVEWEESAGEIVFTKKRDTGRIGMLFFLALWSLGAIPFAYGAFTQPSLLLFAIGTPLWLVWIAGACMLIWCWFGSQTLVLNVDGVLFHKSAIILLVRREIPLREIKSFREYYKQDSDGPTRGIEIQTLGKPLQLGTNLTDEERVWILHRLNRLLLNHKGVSEDESATAATAGQLSQRDPTGIKPQTEPEPTAEGPFDTTPEPARPEKLSIYFEKEPDRLTLIRRPSGGLGCLIIFLIGLQIPLTLLCLLCTLVNLFEPSTGSMGLAIFTWLLWLPGGAFTLWRLFSRKRVRLTPEGATYRHRVLFTLFQRSVPLEQIRGFRQGATDQSTSDNPIWTIELDRPGPPIPFMKNLPFRERLWLVYQLNEFLEAHQPVNAPTVSTASQCSHFRSLNGNMVDDGEPLSLENALDEPPSDSRWHRADEMRVMAFESRGRVDWKRIFQMLFLSGFWNGLLSVFLLAVLGYLPLQEEIPGLVRYFIALFLTPFLWIGLLLLEELIRSVCEPWRRTTWRFEKDRIERRTEWPIFRKRKRWPATSLDRLELRRPEKKYHLKTLKDAVGEKEEGENLQLAFIDRHNTDLFTIDDLTEGEARWMAHGILTHRWSWFGEGGGGASG